ncbi:MAG TPA: nucleotidyltransferase domain-containing protein [Caulobacteraceae bacterium]|jgi:hypothetical protein
MPSSFEIARAHLLDALTRFAEEDPRIVALWLQGSLASGQADPFSDIDAYLAVKDDAFESLWAARETVLERLGGTLAWSNATTPGLTAVHALMTGGARLDLFFEKALAAPNASRPFVKALVDKAGLSALLKTDWQAPAPMVARIVQTIIRMTRQGATWPLRVLGRGQWSTLAMMELDLINAQLAQLMAVCHDAANFYRNSFSLPAVLTEAERAELDDLTTRALEALAAEDSGALKQVHLRLLDALVREGRAACAALDVDYPITEDGEREIRALLEAGWPS